MKYKIAVFGFVMIILFFSCEKYWDDHYKTIPETVNQNVWEALQNENNLSIFVQYIKDRQYDTLFLTDYTYTLFVPDNEAFNNYLDTGIVTNAILDYHISSHFLQPWVLKGKNKIQTLAEKFALFENYSSTYLFDGIPLEFESPLYLNGKYFIMGEVALPKPNLYEYYEENNPVLAGYIESLDSLILDKEKSRPVGFDTNGNTIYDTVAEIYNSFEAEFFPVREEFRYKTATMVFPKKDDYNNALTEMALTLGTIFQDYNDIPLKWQYDILIPLLLEQGVFENMLEETEFMKRYPLDTVKLKNILGDSVIINYQPIEKTLCSNGYAYNYADFHIPDTLFSGSTRMEGEWLLKETGVNKFAWYKEVKVISDISFEPLQEYIATASNDTIIKVYFTKGYTGSYSVEFNVENLLPRKYLMQVFTHMDIGGIYDVYVNDELVTTFDYYTYILNRGFYYSVKDKKRYVPVGRFNIFDCWVENLTEYGKAWIRFEYKGPSRVTSNGLVIDYIDFIPSE